MSLNENVKNLIRSVADMEDIEVKKLDLKLNEQREAIRQCELYVQAKATIQLVDEIDGKLAFKSCDTSAIDTVLSLIKAQQEEISKYKTLYERALSDVVKTDKQIDLMAELVYKRFKAELLLEYGFENEEQLKQYFAGLVEKE